MPEIPQFVHFTNSDGFKVWINPDEIESISQAINPDYQCLLIMKSGDSHKLAMSSEYVIDFLRGTGNVIVIGALVA